MQDDRALYCTLTSISVAPRPSPSTLNKSLRLQPTISESYSCRAWSVPGGWWGGGGGGGGRLRGGHGTGGGADASSLLLLSMSSVASSVACVGEGCPQGLHLRGGGHSVGLAGRGAWLSSRHWMSCFQ